MSGKYTKKNLSEMSNLKFAICILNERMSGLNPYAPLASKLRCSIHTLAELDKPRPRSWWDITYTDRSGEIRSPSDIDDMELERIGKLVEEGYTGGEIFDDGGDHKNG